MDTGRKCTPCPGPPRAPALAALDDGAAAAASARAAAAAAGAAINMGPVAQQQQPCGRRRSPTFAAAAAARAAAIAAGHRCCAARHDGLVSAGGRCGRPCNLVQRRGSCLARPTAAVSAAGDAPWRGPSQQPAPHGAADSACSHGNGSPSPGSGDLDVSVRAAAAVCGRIGGGWRRSATPKAALLARPVAREVPALGHTHGIQANRVSGRGKGRARVEACVRV